MHVIQPGAGIVACEIPLIFGACEFEEDLKYFVRPGMVKANFRHAGSTLTGTIAGRLPDDFACAPGVDFNLPILGTANGFGRFIARFRDVSELEAVCLTVAGGGWRR